MNGIKAEEAQLLKLASEWEKASFQEVFGASKEAESYFTAKEETGYILDYDFETPLELLNRLKEMWKGKIPKNQLPAAAACITAAVFKQQPNCRKEDGQNQSGIEVPMFIYNF